MAMATAAVAATAIPQLARLLVFDRAAIAGGQWWRLMTGNWVHFSTGHLLADMLGLGVAAALIERRESWGALRLCALSALAVGMAVFWLEPGIETYGGLSGIACAAVAYLAVDGATRLGGRRWPFAVALVVLVAKTGWEYATGRALFVSAANGLMVLPLAHGAGTISGMVYWGIERVTKGPRDSLSAVRPATASGVYETP